MNRRTAPGRFQAIIEAVMDADRAYFLDHPGETEYIRRHIPGEFWPNHEFFRGVDLVKVTQLLPGARFRRPLDEVLFFTPQELGL